MVKKLRKGPDKPGIGTFVFALFVIWVILSIVSFMSKPSTIETVAYTTFIESLHNGDVDTIYYDEANDYMTYTLFNDETKQMSLEERASYEYAEKDTKRCLYPSYDEFRKDMLMADANLVRSDNTLLTNILGLLINLMFPIMLLFMLFASQKHSVNPKDLIQTSDVSFDDIIGHDEIVDDVRFITELIKDPTKGDKLGAKLPKGLLLAGSPGTGKTLLAKAIAHEAGVPFLYQNASSFIEMYVGLGAKRVRELFKIARKNAPCILFIDEIDAIGEKRGSNKGTSENEQTINAILQEMDGFNGREGVFVIAATNRPDCLDDALVRSGRFDRQITINPPKTWKVRKELFKHYLSKFKTSDDIDIDNLSKQLSGFTGADIAMICNEASIIAVMKNKDAVDMACVEEAIDKKIFKGNRSKTGAHEVDRNIIAYHESGHAVMSYLLGEPIARASIQSTISGVGGAVFNQDKDTVFQTDKDFKNHILIAYAGRASEDIKFDNVTTGASNDITQATQLMTQYIERFGFDKQFGLLDVGELSKLHMIDSSIITEKLSKMSVELYDECKELLSKNYDKVEKLALKLLEVETLSGEDIEAICIA